MINLRSATEEILTTNKKEIEDRFLEYYNKILVNQKLINDKRIKFLMKGWLRAYINFTEAMKPSPKFSIRYGGQEIAWMQLKDDKYYLIIDKKHNSGIYGRELPPPGKHEWKKSQEAKDFRKRFEKIPPREDQTIDEHRFESFIIDEMKNKTGNKFAGTFKHIRPVLIADKMPFQMPLPIAARGGKPKYMEGSKAGHIDILARHGKAKPSLTVIEVKRPGGKYDNALAQTFIYTVTLSYLLQRASEEVRIALWKLCGYGSKIYSNIKFNAVVAIPEEYVDMFEKELKCLKPDIDGGNISVKYLFYKLTNDNKIKITKTDLVA